MNQNNQLSKLFELLEEDRNVFLTGGAGVGKSFLVKNLISKYKMLSINSIILGSTGISAVNVGGVTIHSFFALGVSSNFEELMVYDKKNSSKLTELYKILSKCDIIIIDEISMVGAILFDMIFYRLQSANYSGKILLVGDFFQLPPIIKNKPQNSLFQEEFAFESASWRYLNPSIFELTFSKRTKDREFSQILNQIRVGNLNENILNYIKNLTLNKKPMDATYLYGTNYLATQRNLYCINQIPTKEVALNCSLEFLDKKYNKQSIQNWINSLPIEENLILKIGAKIIFSFNKWGEYYNGESGIVRDIVDETIYVEKSNKKVVKVVRSEFVLSRLKIKNNGNFTQKEIAKLNQFPIKLAYAITIHKSQGMSIENLVCNVDKIFTESQFYVAISRAIEPKKLSIEYGGYNLKNYLQKVIKVSNKVVEFYQNNKSLKENDD